MFTYAIEGEDFETHIGVEEGVVVACDPSLMWTQGFEWQHIRRYFEQHGFNVHNLGD